MWLCFFSSFPSPADTRAWLFVSADLRRCWISSAEWSSSCRFRFRTLTSWSATSWRTTAICCPNMTLLRPRTQWLSLKRTAGLREWRPAGSGNVSGKGASFLPADRTQNSNMTQLIRISAVFDKLLCCKCEVFFNTHNVKTPLKQLCLDCAFYQIQTSMF